MANRTLIHKQRRSLSKDIGKMKSFEILGVKSCDSTWDELFKRFIIIDALSASPCGFLSTDEENCLMAKINEKCNC